LSREVATCDGACCKRCLSNPPPRFARLHRLRSEGIRSFAGQAQGGDQNVFDFRRLTFDV
ncbi:MAG TPA: hypothetical protein VIL33_00650, partial [Rhodothermia bacterium]